MKSRFTRVLSFVLTLGMLLSVCGVQGAGAVGVSGAAPGETASAKDTFVYGLTAEPKTLDGLLADDFVAYTITNNLYDNLIIQEPDGSLTPGLAESWTYNDIGDEITFALRKGVKFHDGSEMTAADVKFTFDHDIDHPPAANLTSAMDRMEIVDDYTVKLFLKHPFGPIEYAISGSQLAIVSKAAYEADPAGFARKPVGTGPYKINEWFSGDKITITRHDDYWQGAPVIKDVTFKIITDISTAVIALENGEIDMVQPNTTDRDNLMANSDVTYYEVEQQSTYFLAMNNKRGLFTNKDMRLALAYAVDREALLVGALDGIGAICNTPMARVFGHPGEFDWYDYNPEKAKEHLAAAGYPDGLTITFTTMNSTGYSKPTEIIQDQLRKVGITVVIDRMERAAFLDAVITRKDYEIAVMSATAFYPDSDYLFAMYHSDPTEEGRNYHLNEDPVLDGLLEEARVLQDSEGREALYLQVCERFKEEAFQVPLYVMLANMAASSKLRGYEISPLRRVYVKYFNWVE